MSNTAQIPLRDRHFPAGAVAARYGVSVRALNRWLELKVLPEPDVIIAGRRYWKLASLEESDRKNTINATTKFSGRAKYPRGHKVSAAE